jgi:hypothetical protein
MNLLDLCQEEVAAYLPKIYVKLDQLFGRPTETILVSFCSQFLHSRAVGCTSTFLFTRAAR